MALYDTLSSLIYSPSSHPRDPDGYHDALSDYLSSRLDHAGGYTTHLSPARARMLHSTRQERHRACFTSSVEDCAYRLSTILESPSMELPQCPLDFGVQLTWTPPHSGGAQGLEWCSQEDLSLLPPSDDMRPIDFSNIGFMRAFIDDLRTDRDLVESSASSEINHGSAIELDYSSDTSISAIDSASSTSSKARKSKLVRRVLRVFRRS